MRSTHTFEIPMFREIGETRGTQRPWLHTPEINPFYAVHQLFRLAGFELSRYASLSKVSLFLNQSC